MTKNIQGRVFVEGLRMHARHGVLDQERRVGNDYVVSVWASLDLARATQTDDVDDTINYAMMADIVNEEMQTESNLVEHVAARIARSIIAQWPQVSHVGVRVMKENPPMGYSCAGAGVELTFSHDDF